MSTKAKRAAAGRAPGAAVPAASPADQRATARAADERLAEAIPRPRVELDFESAWQLVVATILSAQSTDKRVNQVTPVLFARWPTPAALAAAAQDEVEDVVRSTGFFRNKAKAIREASRAVAERFGGEVPRTMEALLELPGVARKTANVVLGSAYGIPAGVVVDTHAGRVARRLGLTAEDDPVQVERALMALFPVERWIDVGHRLVLHGRYLCLARGPRCGQCPLNELCPSREGAAPEAPWRARAALERGVVESRGASGLER